MGRQISGNQKPHGINHQRIVAIQLKEIEKELNVGGSHSRIEKGVMTPVLIDISKISVSLGVVGGFFTRRKILPIMIQITLFDLERKNMSSQKKINSANSAQLF